MDSTLSLTNLQRDLGTVVDSSIKTSTPGSAAVEKANGILGRIKKGS